MVFVQGSALSQRQMGTSGYTPQLPRPVTGPNLGCICAALSPRSSQKDEPIAYNGNQSTSASFLACPHPLSHSPSLPVLLDHSKSPACTHSHSRPWVYFCVTQLPTALYTYLAVGSKILYSARSFLYPVFF